MNGMIGNSLVPTSDMNDYADPSSDDIVASILADIVSQYASEKGTDMSYSVSIVHIEVSTM